MLDWIGAQSDVINVVASVAMVVIWVFYLQIFFVTFRRQRRTSIHIDRGVASDDQARCIVTNLSQQPIYLLAVVVDFGEAGHHLRAVVTDRDELADKAVSTQLERTNQGPLAQGEARDVGSLAELMQRARARLDAEIPRSEIERMCVSVVAISNQGDHIVAARKDFDAEHRKDGRVLFTPATVLTRQIRTRTERRELEDFLEDRREV